MGTLLLFVKARGAEGVDAERIGGEMASDGGRRELRDGDHAELIVESGFEGVEGLLSKADDGPVSTSKHKSGITFLRAGGGSRRVWAADTPFYHEVELKLHAD